jgi:hypothetical protein
MKKWIFILALISVLFVFAGCASDETPEEEPVPEVPANKIDSPVLTPERQEPVVVPEQTIQEEPDATFITDWIDLVVDDDENCGFFIPTDELGTFSSIEGEFKKDSGNESSCFGFVFGYSAQENGIVPDYFRFAINVKGEYSIHAWDGNSYKDCIDPEADTAYLYKSDVINTGYGEINTLKIATDAEGLLSFFINDTEVASKIEPFENSTSGIMVFFSIGTKQEENLSETPVKFSYRITDSVAANDFVPVSEISQD